MTLSGKLPPPQQRTLFFENNGSSTYNSSSMHPLHTVDASYRGQPPLAPTDHHLLPQSMTGSPHHTSRNFDNTDLSPMLDRLSINHHEENRSSSPGRDASFPKSTQRSMSVDVGYASSVKSNGKLSTPIKSLLTKSRNADTNGLQPDCYPSNQPYLRSYSGSSECLSLLGQKYSNYATLFPSSSNLDLAPSLRRNTARPNKSVESLRSKSWTQQYLESTTDPSGLTPSTKDSMTGARGSAPFYGQTRRSSYGLPGTNDIGNDKHNCLPAEIKLKCRLSASHSYSDLHDAAMHSYCYASTSASSQPPMSMVPDVNELPAVTCPQFQLYGSCVFEHQCPYAHTHGAPVAHFSDRVPFSPLIYHQHAIPSGLVPNPGHPLKPNTSPAAAPLPMPTSRSLGPSHPETSGTGRVNHRRQSEQENNRFAGAKLEDFQGSIYELCKDQNGCRFFQKKLEESNPKNLQMIFDEIKPHFTELMTEPFGNYLCQKLIEHCNEAQRDILVETVAPDLLKISLNMHGTRAVQRFIEFLSTPYQVELVTKALQPNVVTLIKDLNGNHVIQKCLHRLSAEQKQFIYDTMGEQCTQVATHRHGCCVLQRCVDFASDAQKTQLVKVITQNALTLVQDPFGNYVVQYILDLGDIAYTDTLVRCFIDHICELSVQKFSSNVIEKCIRVAEPETRRLLVAKMIDEANIEKLLRDSFANYVVQTCLDYADPDQRVQLVELIRPLLPSIRNTPYGKRIHSKIQRETPSQGQPRTLHRAKSDLQTSSSVLPPMPVSSSSAQTTGSRQLGMNSGYVIHPIPSVYQHSNTSSHAYASAALPLTADPLFQYH